MFVAAPAEKSKRVILTKFHIEMNSKNGQYSIKKSQYNDTDILYGEDFRVYDAIDEGLLAELRDNARISTSELARRLGLSRSTVQSRLNRMLETRLITGFTVQLGETYAENLIQAHVLIKLDQKLTGQALTSIKKIHKVNALYAISGAYDMIAIVEAHSTEELSQLLDEIANLDGIERTNSSLILETKFDR